jgi:hypothetical protein
MKVQSAPHPDTTELDPKSGNVARPAVLWNDASWRAHGTDLVAERKADTRAKTVGSVPLASFTVTKLRWLPHDTSRGGSHRRRAAHDLAAGRSTTRSRRPLVFCHASRTARRACGVLLRPVRSL